MKIATGFPKAVSLSLPLELSFEFIDPLTLVFIKAVSKNWRTLSSKEINKRWTLIKKEFPEFISDALIFVSFLKNPPLFECNYAKALVVLVCGTIDFKEEFSFIYDENTKSLKSLSLFGGAINKAKANAFEVACDLPTKTFPIQAYAFMIKAKKAEVQHKIDSIDFTSQPLHQAAFHLNFPLIHLLLDNGADKNGRDSRGRTPLDRAFNSSEHIQGRNAKLSILMELGFKRSEEVSNSCTCTIL